MSIKERVIEWWDWKVYWLATGTLRRMCERNGGFAYLFQLSIADWLKEHPLPDSLKSSTESFYRTQKESARSS